MSNKPLSEEELDKLLGGAIDSDDISDVIADLEINDEDNKPSKFFDVNGNKKEGNTTACIYDFRRPDFVTKGQLDYLSSLFHAKIGKLVSYFKKYRDWYVSIDLARQPLAILTTEEYLRSVTYSNQFCYELSICDKNGKDSRIGFLSFDKSLPLNGVLNRKISEDELTKLNKPDLIDLTIINQVFALPFVNYINSITGNLFQDDGVKKNPSYHFVGPLNLSSENHVQGVEIDLVAHFEDCEGQISIFLLSDIVEKIVGKYFSEKTNTKALKEEYSDSENAIVSIGAFKWNNGENVKKGNIFELSKDAGDSVDIVVNGKSVAKGEIMVVENHFALRIM